MTNREWLEAMDNEQITDFCYHIFKYLFPAADEFKETVVTILMNWLKTERNEMEALSDKQLAMVLAQILCLICFPYDRESRDYESIFANHKPFIEEQTMRLTEWLEEDSDAICSKWLLWIVDFEEPTIAVTNDR